MAQHKGCWAGRGARGQAGREKGLIPSAQHLGGCSWTSVQFGRQKDKLEMLGDPQHPWRCSESKGHSPYGTMELAGLWAGDLQRHPPHHLNPPVSPHMPLSWVSFTC